MKTARKYDVSKYRVRRRFRRIIDDSTNIEDHNKRLNYDEDQALYVYIDLADDIDLSIREKTLVMTINAILRNHYIDSSSLSSI